MKYAGGLRRTDGADDIGRELPGLIEIQARNLSTPVGMFLIIQIDSDAGRIGIRYPDAYGYVVTLPGANQTSTSRGIVFYTAAIDHADSIPFTVKGTEQNHAASIQNGDDDVYTVGLTRASKGHIEVVVPQAQGFNCGESTKGERGRFADHQFFVFANPLTDDAVRRRIDLG